jgi:predicted DNA-binding protein YlxM (UPF0122 family)
VKKIPAIIQTLRGENVRCEEPVTVLEILRLTEKHHSQRQIANSVKVSKTTVHEIQKRCREIGLSYNQASELSDEEIKSLVYPLYSGRKVIKPDPDFESIKRTLQQDPNKNCNTCGKITGLTTLKA